MSGEHRPIALVSMPTLATDVPSFQLALLTPTLRRAGFEVEPMSLFMRFGAEVGPRLNDALAEVYPCMVGEWIWSKAAFGATIDDEAYLRRYQGNLRELCARAGCTVDDIVRLRDDVAPAFIDAIVDSVDWSRYGLVGLTVVFQQMVASLALARALKERYPELPIIMGGASFEDDIAAEVMARAPAVDMVHCGDADRTFPELAARLGDGRSLAGLGGVMWREDGVVRDEGRAANLDDLDFTPIPDFDEFFQARRTNGLDRHQAREAMLPIETARGCWYGMKHHCVFCGLNRSGMEFRRKSPEHVLAMLRALSTRYGTRYFNAIDNILAPAYVSRLFGALAEGHSDLRIHYEIRPSITRAQLGAMRKGGLTSVQPGIESFSTHVLTLMKKNTTAMQNLELLKWTTYHGIANSYNILYGFKGETAEDYCRQADVLRLIPHLQPPYAICQARPDRGSPMFEHPDDHAVTVLRPAACYRHIYPAPWNLARISYFFEHELDSTLPPRDAYDECIELVGHWKQRWHGRDRPQLSYLKTWDSISVHDGRQSPTCSVRYDGWRATLYEACADAESREELRTAVDVDATCVDDALADFLDRRLMIALDGRYLALALPQNPHY